ncbi:uncharacterized protein LOC141564029 [Sminthopsis crassicaudata]|uniref:uncharacterized protein LOC141564029 n=1 Tax=Sminthopsis crassicaudata TaxID=9301 RepID=UPI003D69991F
MGFSPSASQWIGHSHASCPDKEPYLFVPPLFALVALVSFHFSDSVPAAIFTLHLSSLVPRCSSCLWVSPVSLYAGTLCCQREALFARLRQAHQNRTSFSEEQLREAVATGKILGPPVGKGRAARAPQVDEAQRRMDAEIWQLLSSFAAPPPPRGPGHIGPESAASLRAAPPPSSSSSSSSFSQVASLSSPATPGSGTPARLAGSQFSLAHKAFSQPPERVYYWQLPRIFLGDKVMGAGGQEDARIYGSKALCVMEAPRTLGGQYN